jgi:RimJ/RimL family protein N-acetyltransferase
MILGERIRLRAIEREDLPLFVAWLNDLEVRQYLLMDMPLSQAQEENWFENMLKKDPRQHPLMIEITTSPGWVPVGNISLFDFDDKNHSAELGIMIGNKNYWDKGYGREAVNLICKHGFKTLNLHRIHLKVYAANQRGIRAYEKAGFVHEGRLRQAMFFNGEYIDIVFMGILRSEWQENNALSGETK